MINGVFKRNRVSSWIVLFCGVFLMALFSFVWHKDDEATAGTLIFGIALGLFFVLIAVWFLLLNRKAFLHIENDRIIGRCGWVCKFDITLSDIKFVSVAHNSLVITLKSSKRIFMAELVNAYDIYYFICRRISFDSGIKTSERKNEFRSAKSAQKKGFIIIIGSIIWMFVVIALAVLLTGGKDFPDFTQSDWIVFGIMCAVLVLTVIPMFIIAGKTGKATTVVENSMYALRRSVIESAPLLPGNIARVVTDDFYSFRLTVFCYPNSDSVYYAVEQFDKEYNLIPVYESEVYENFTALGEDLIDMIDITEQILF